MGDILKFPGQWHGPDQENPDSELGPTEADENELVTEISPEHLATMLEALKIYMPDDFEKARQAKAYETMIDHFQDNEIMSKIKFSSMGNWAKSTVFYDCLYQEAKRRGLIKE